MTATYLATARPFLATPVWQDGAWLGGGVPGEQGCDFPVAGVGGGPSAATVSRARGEASLKKNLDKGGQTGRQAGRAGWQAVGAGAARGGGLRVGVGGEGLVGLVSSVRACGGGASRVASAEPADGVVHKGVYRFFGYCPSTNLGANVWRPNCRIL
jgi:hypothetical protein